MPDRVRSIDPVAPQAAVLQEAASHIAAAGVVAFPTETFYGLAADPRREDAVAVVYAIKGRAFTDALPLIAASRGDVEALVGGLQPQARRLADRFWPGPLTLVLPLPGGTLAPAVSAGRPTIAVRVSDHPVACALAAAAGGLITSTSANRSGEPAATTVAQLVALGSELALILDGGPVRGLQPSTIVDVTEGAVRLVRAGQVPFDRVLESLQ